MKVQSVELKYLKKIRNSTFDFTDLETGLAQDIIVLIGMNGAGKTSLLQAIAATLGVATGRLQKLPDLDWTGFNYELLGTNWGRFEPEVTLKAQFSSQELHAVQEFHHKLQEIGRHLPVPPARDYLATLRWQGERVQADTADQAFDAAMTIFEVSKQFPIEERYSLTEVVGLATWSFGMVMMGSSSLTRGSEFIAKINGEKTNTVRQRLKEWYQDSKDKKGGKRRELDVVSLFSYLYYIPILPKGRDAPWRVCTLQNRLN